MPCFIAIRDELRNLTTIMICRSYWGQPGMSMLQVSCGKLTYREGASSEDVGYAHRSQGLGLFHHVGALWESQYIETIDPFSRVNKDCD